MTIHNHVSLNGRKPLDESQLRRLAPSIFATEAHHSRSERFTPIPTWDIVQALGREGFVPYRAGQSTTRQPDRSEFTKHLVRFRREDREGLRVDGNIFEIVLVNGNDGSSAYKLDAGVFRIVCLNGLVVKSQDAGSVRVRHTGNVVDNVIEGTYEVLGQAERVLTAAQDWRHKAISSDAQLAFAEEAHTIRFGEDGGTAIQPRQLLIARRPGDEGDNLWSTFNRIQENVIRGGIGGFVRNAETGRRRRSTTREVHGIDQDQKVNKALWGIASLLSERSDLATVTRGG